MNISFEEYKTRLLNIRLAVYSLLDDMETPYSEKPEMLEKVLNIALNGDLTATKEGKIKTEKIISVMDYHKTRNQPEYI